MIISGRCIETSRIATKISYRKVRLLVFAVVMEQVYMEDLKSSGVSH